MRRFLPHPLLFAVLVGMWLLLAQSVSPGQILLGALVALLATHGYAALRPEPVRIRSVRAVVKLAVIVATDIVRSNFAVARIILFRPKYVSGFVQLPLEMQSLHGRAVLAGIITATPGTIWVQLDRSSGMLLVHVLDLVDEDEWVALIKRRYETLLIEIFGP